MPTGMHQAAKYLNRPRSSHLTSSQSEVRPTRNDTVAPMPRCVNRFDWPTVAVIEASFASLMISNRHAPPITGIAIRNENVAADVGASPSRNPADMVVPLRDSPGKIASAWLAPISARSCSSSRDTRRDRSNGEMPKSG